jgi:adenosylmethionine-8-amino-7-oxononanoate aminotransferase
VSDLVGRDRAHVWHPYAAGADAGPLFPVVAASGTRLTLADGRELIDGMSSWWAAIHGYGHPTLDAAIHAQVDRFAHVMFGGLTHEPAVELAELLVSITPPSLNRVFFADSGSVAVEVAIKMALQYWHGRGQPQRRFLLTVRGGYYGDTAGAMSICDPVGGMHTLFHDYVAQQLFVDRPRPRYGEVVKPLDLQGVQTLIEERGSEIAALVVEPIVQGAGGMWFYSADYLRSMVALCRANGILVIFDEIATGFGRTGELFALEHAAVVPDIMTVGKALTGGYLTLAATLCSDEISDGISAAPGSALMHGPTFMANPLACAVAKASVDLLLVGPWRQGIADISTRLSAGLAAAWDLPGVVDVRVLGAIGVVELAEAVDMDVIQPRLVDEGVWIRPFGRLVYTMPPYISSPDDIDALTRAICAALS